MRSAVRELHCVTLDTVAVGRLRRVLRYERAEILRDDLHGANAWEIGDEPQATSYSLDIIAHGRDQAITSTLQARDAVLADAHSLGDSLLRQALIGP